MPRREKLKAKIIKEGGKKGVEIEGASDMGGLDFFCTTMELPDGNLEYLELSMLAMNAEPDPEAEDRKGCSGHIGKMIFSASVEQLALVAYVPAGEFNKSADKVDVTAWMNHVLDAIKPGEVTKPAFSTISRIPDKKTGDILTGTDGKINGKVVVAVAKSNPEAGKFALKDKDAAMAAAFAYLRSKGAFPEDNDEDSDEMVFGDDDNLDDYMEGRSGIITRRESDMSALRTGGGRRAPVRARWAPHRTHAEWAGPQVQRRVLSQVRCAVPQTLASQTSLGVLEQGVRAALCAASVSPRHTACCAGGASSPLRVWVWKTMHARRRCFPLGFVNEKKSPTVQSPPHSRRCSPCTWAGRHRRSCRSTHFQARTR